MSLVRGVDKLKKLGLNAWNDPWIEISAPKNLQLIFYQPTLSFMLGLIFRSLDSPVHSL